ncbi:MAG TPA: muropeptide transporter AmpG [Deltaproteobacteria bacterium]|nr:MAG: muropeptide transporter AmpG [Deltaproteobacteria bacterium GWC2_65_14]HBO70163.1 muropeptide transporter AmpG [Deltaproteobacteria bacterium]
MATRLSETLKVFRSRRIGVMVLAGFSSGLPLALTGGTLQAWMTVAGVDLRTIGIFALVGLPYTVKFLWSPLMDRFVPPLFGRRRGWMLLTQAALVLGIVAMAAGNPAEAPLALGALALLVAFFSASQDIVIDAYRTDVLHPPERGLGAAVFVTGYRVAMLVSGALALILSERIGWRSTYLLMAGLMGIGIATTLFCPEPEAKGIPPKTLREAVLSPLSEFFSRRGAVALLFLIVLYKLGDAYAGTLTTAFLIRGVGFSPTDVGTLNKGLGLVSLIVGAMFGGTWMIRLGLYRSLLIFGALQAVSNLSFMVLSWVGKSYGMLVFTVAFENLCGGMGTAAFVALLMALCDNRYTATQYALLSSLAALGRIFVAPTSGFLVESVGWGVFFLFTALSALPGLGVLWRLRGEISSLSAKRG